MLHLTPNVWQPLWLLICSYLNKKRGGRKEGRDGGRKKEKEGEEEERKEKEKEKEITGGWRDAQWLRAYTYSCREPALVFQYPCQVTHSHL